MTENVHECHQGAEKRTKTKCVFERIRKKYSNTLRKKGFLILSKIDFLKVRLIVTSWLTSSLSKPSSSAG